MVGLAVAERGAISGSYLDDDYLLGKWQKYGKSLLCPLKGITNEEQITNLKKLDSILEEFGNSLQIVDNRHLTFEDYNWKNFFCIVEKEFPSKSDIFVKFLNLVSKYGREKVEKGEFDKFDTLGGYKNTCNFIQNSRRAIKRIINNKPLYLIQQERNNFWHLANELSYAPEKRF